MANSEMNGRMGGANGVHDTGLILSRFRFLLYSLPLLTSLTWVGGSRSNAYGVSEYFLNYRHGFIKRGLFGELLTRVGYLSIAKLHVIELLLVCAAVLLSYAVFWRDLRSGSKRALGAVLLLCSPGCLAHFSYLAAQPDILLYMLLLVAFACLTRLPGGWAPYVALVPCILAILTHEAFALLFYPVIAAILWDGYIHRRFRGAAVLAHFAVFCASFLLVVKLGVIHTSSSVLLSEARARTNFPVDPEIFIVLTRSLRQQWDYLAGEYTRRVMAAVMVSILLLVPYLAGILWLARKENAERDPAMPSWTPVAVFGIPMLLCILGDDVLRWLAGSVVCLLLYVVYLLEKSEPNSNTATAKSAGVAAYGSLILYGFAIGPMGGATVQILARLVTMLGVR